ncbi:Hypothetical predicted protein [Octopus vulgaris]|uniref:Uncharacterized protein n=1 Tax=Octopus vulgaris TaxID=6645 RepID=A0AA36AMK9_OCTVU|nr:Hypothetical predicted protein [Octopus vulgaris]
MEQEDSEPEVSDPSRIVSTVGALYEAFGLKSVSSLPGKTKRESIRMEDFDEAAKKRLVKLTSTIMKKDNIDDQVVLLFDICDDTEILVMATLQLFDEKVSLFHNRMTKLR